VDSSSQRCINFRGYITTNGTVIIGGEWVSFGKKRGIMPGFISIDETH
jgi:hypothetical protein